MHVFNYSRRTGTRAAIRPDQGPGPIREERSHRMAEVARENERAFLKRQVGKELSVLFEARGEDGLQIGYARNYLPVGVHTDRDLTGRIETVYVERIEGGLCLGR